jgi:hypothetical protein
MYGMRLDEAGSFIDRLVHDMAVSVLLEKEKGGEV